MGWMYESFFKTEFTNDVVKHPIMSTRHNTDYCWTYFLSAMCVIENAYMCMYFTTCLQYRTKACRLVTYVVHDEGAKGVWWFFMDICPASSHVCIQYQVCTSCLHTHIHYQVYKWLICSRCSLHVGNGSMKCSLKLSSQMPHDIVKHPINMYCVHGGRINGKLFFKSECAILKSNVQF